MFLRLGAGEVRPQRCLSPALGVMVIVGLEPFLLDPEWNQACLAAERKQWYLLCGVTAGLKMCKKSTEEIQDPVKEFSFSLWPMTRDAKWTQCHFHFKKQNWYAGRSCSPFYNSGWFVFFFFFFSLTRLIWLFPAHGTFLGHIRLEPHKPQQIPIDSTVSFGASTRAYTLREKPQTLPSAVKGDEKMGGEDDELKGLLGLPEEETELDVIPVYLIILSLGTLVFAVCVCSLYLGMSMT